MSLLRAARRLVISNSLRPGRYKLQPRVLLRTTASASQSPNVQSQRCSILDEQRIVAPPGYNRWLQFLPSMGIGVCIGSYLAVPSILGPFLCRAQGVVVQATCDLTMGTLMPCVTLMPLFAGIIATVMARHSEKLGLRRLGLIGTLFPLGCFVGSAAAIYANSLAGFVASYVMLGGIGFYATYPQIPPFLFRWFPDKRGLAVSTYFASFGSGVLCSTPILQALLSHFRCAPTRLGSLEEVATTLGPGGQRIASVNGTECEVVAATTRDIIDSGFVDLAEGVFILGTGSSGVCESMACYGGVLFMVMQSSAWALRVPAHGWKPDLSMSQGSTQTATTETETPQIPLEAAQMTPHLYLLSLGTLGVTMTGLPFLTNAKFLINDMFSGALGPAALSAAATFPALLSAASLSGRFVWGPVSDKIGRGATYAVLGLSVPTLCAVPLAAGMVSTDPATALMIFRTAAFSTVVLFAGGPVLLAPALSDIFGLRSTNQLYNRVFFMIPLANVLGTTVLTRLRDYSYKGHALRIAGECNEAEFTKAFGGNLTDVAALVDSKTVTLPLLMKIAPPGTIDPSPLLYNEVFYMFAGTSAIACVCNTSVFFLLRRPLSR